jgi:enoyl-CoA hydratase
MSEVVSVERVGDVALIILNRPTARNAMNVALAAASCDAVEACQDAGAIVITGADPAFCAGLDLRDLGVEALSDLPPFNATVAASAVPVIAAVNGPAVTGGFELALAADFIVASERATFADTHLRVGVYPGPVLVDLPRRVGPAWAREISLTGNFIDAATALRIGIANHLVPHEELIPFTLRLAEAIAEQDRTMVSTMRRDWDASFGAPIAESRRIHDDYARQGGFRDQATAGGIASHREAVVARARQQRHGPDREGSMGGTT